FRQWTVVLEVALALTLVSSAGLMSESFARTSVIDLGFNPKNVLTLSLFLSPAQHGLAQALRFHQELIRRIGALPGVESVAAASNLPLYRITMRVPFDLESAPPRPQGERPDVGYTGITPGYLETLGIPLKRGRAFTDSDHETAPPVAIV